MTARLTQRQLESSAVFVGRLVPVVGRPVVVVTYMDYSPTPSGSRRESGTYWSFFSHEKASFSSAVCQRLYFQDTHPRLGPETMMERTRDEAELALTEWLRKHYGGELQIGSFAMQKVDLETLFSLFTFSQDVRECVAYLRSHVDHGPLRAAFADWENEFAVDAVPLRIPA